MSANRGTDLRVNRSLELLTNLTRTCAETAKKEETLTRDLLARRYTTSKKYQDAAAVIDSGLKSRCAEANATFDASTARIKKIYGNRLARVERAHLVAIRQLPRGAKDARSSWLGAIQMRLHRLKQQYQDSLDSTGALSPEETARLDEQRARLAVLEKRARSFFSGYDSFKKTLRRKRSTDETEIPSGPRRRLIESLRSKLDALEIKLDEFRAIAIPRVFSIVPLPLIFLIVVLIGTAVAFGMGMTTTSIKLGAMIAGFIFAGAIILHMTGSNQAKAAVTEISAAFSAARLLNAACGGEVTEDAVGYRQQLQQQFEADVAGIESEREQAEQVEADFKSRWQHKLDAQVARMREKIPPACDSRVALIETARSAQLAQLQAQADSQKQGILQGQDTDLGSFTGDEDSRWAVLEQEWKQAITPLYASLQEMNNAEASRPAGWGPSFVASWKPQAEFASAARFGHLDVDLPKAGVPKDPRLALPGAAQIQIPLALDFPAQGSVLFETSETSDGAVVDVLNNIVLRLFTAMPPGKLAVTIIDPVGLGKNFAGLMHLGDYEPSLINRRIWTQREQIDERLAELSEHIEKVIQMYLRNEFATISEYNASAGTIAEKYHVLVVSDFPADFSESAAKRLQNIIISGARCGVFTLIHWDKRQSLPDGIGEVDLRKASVCIRRERGQFVIAPEQTQGTATLVLDSPPDAEIAAALVHKVGKASVDSNRVEVPFTQIAPKADEFWTSDTTSEVRVAVGRTGATKLQMLAIGKGTRQHALFAGKTGSGKSTLFHVIITNLALACSPDAIEFYLIDFKKGVEFKCYATHRLPHARVVAIESDREFGLSVLQRVDEELKRRGDIFRKLGVQDLAGYKRSGATDPIPRTLLIIDEFQEFYTEDDQIAQTASLLFDRIVRQGRAFGIHVLLGSQTLGGAYTIARATLGQMVIRVALQCNEADSYLIMDENNSAPRMLSRPGEGIYNDAAGAMEGNSPFQVCWLSDEERDGWLEKVHQLALDRGDKHAGPIVFEGNAPAEVRENYDLEKALATKPAKRPSGARIWLGAPNSIKGPTQAAFHRQSGNHLLIVGQRDEAIVDMLGLSLIALAAQHPAGTAKFFFLHSAAPGTGEAEWLEKIFALIPHGVRVVKMHELAEAMNELGEEVKQRSSGDGATDAPPIYIFIHDFQKWKKLKSEDDFSFSMGDSDAGANPAQNLSTLLTEGASLGLHVIATVDTFNNVGRFLNRKALTEFEMRVVFQMSANDSSSLIDSPKAGGLGLHRALLYNEHEGTLETFRPYATPDSAWIDEAAQKLA